MASRKSKKVIMKKLVSTAILLAGFFESDAAVYTLGGPVVNPSNGHSYYLLSPSSWTDAQSYAQSLGGNLATIRNSTEQNWVFNTFSSYGNVSRTLWIGLNDVASEGQFVWASGEAVNYTMWSPGEPNNLGPEDYVFIFPPSDSRAGYWNDNDNFGTIALSTETILVNGVIEVVPEPSSIALGLLGAGTLAAWKRRKG